MTITGSSVGYEKSSITITIKNSSPSPIVIVLPFTQVLGETVLVTSTSRVTLGMTTIKYTTGVFHSIKKIIPAVTMKMFPNPIRGSQALSIVFKNPVEERVRVNLYSLDGKLLQSEILHVIEGENWLQFHPKETLIPSGYLVQVMNKKGIIIFSEKLIVQ